MSWLISKAFGWIPSTSTQIDRDSITAMNVDEESSPYSTASGASLRGIDRSNDDRNQFPDSMDITLMERATSSGSPVEFSTPHESITDMDVGNESITGSVDTDSDSDSDGGNNKRKFHQNLVRRK